MCQDAESEIGSDNEELPGQATLEKWSKTGVDPDMMIAFAGEAAQLAAEQQYHEYFVRQREIVTICSAIKLLSDTPGAQAALHVAEQRLQEQMAWLQHHNAPEEAERARRVAELHNPAQIIPWMLFAVAAPCGVEQQDQEQILLLGMERMRQITLKRVFLFALPILVPLLAFALDLGEVANAR